MVLVFSASHTCIHQCSSADLFGYSSAPVISGLMASEESFQPVWKFIVTCCYSVLGQVGQGSSVAAADDGFAERGSVIS